MTISLLLFIVIGMLLISLIAWSAHPPKQAPLTADEALESLSQERHYARLPQILQALREDDTDFLRDRGHQRLLARVREERRRIALNYLRYLEQEFQVLVECSRILARLAPELRARSEFELFRQNLRFVWTCRYLRWRIRLGMAPWDAFGALSEMAGTLTLQLEAATARLGERALLAKDES